MAAVRAVAICVMSMCIVAGVADSVLAAPPDIVRRVVVLDREGRQHAGILTAIENGSLIVRATPPARLPLENVVWLKWLDRNTQFRTADPLVLLASGDVLALRASKIEHDTLVGSWAGFRAWSPLRVPLELVRAAILARPADAAADAGLWNRVTSHHDPHDLVLLANGDSLSGEFVSLGDETLTLKGATGETPLARAGVQAVAFNPNLVARLPASGAQAIVMLIDGSRLQTKGLRLVPPDRLELQPTFGDALDVPLLAVHSLRFLGGCATWLSQVEPLEYRFQPFLGLDWPWRADRNVSGGPLRLRGAFYPVGIGVHSRSELTYALDRKYRWFQATIGIDDNTSGKGSCVFEVQVDGKTAFRSDVLTGASPAVALERIDLSGGNRLTLRVDYGTLGDIQDHANWCDAVIVK